MSSDENAKPADAGHMLSKKQMQAKIDELQKALEEQKRLADERLEKIKYLQADFDNYRKQLDKEKTRIIELANESLIKDIIAVLDDFDAAMFSVCDKDKEGIVMMQKKLRDILEANGLSVIEAEGKFDPYRHEVVMKEESEKEEGTVLESLQKGFMLRSKVIRPAKVKVSAGKAAGSGSGKNE